MKWWLFGHQNRIFMLEKGFMASQSKVQGRRKVWKSEAGKLYLYSQEIISTAGYPGYLNIRGNSLKSENKKKSFLRNKFCGKICFFLKLKLTQIYFIVRNNFRIVLICAKN